MITRFFPHGHRAEHPRGGARWAVCYLLSERDHQGHVRATPPRLLDEADPELFIASCEAAPGDRTYTAGAIAFAVEDEPSEEVKRQIRVSFERDVLFPGIDPDSYSVLWVEHRDKEVAGSLRTELHFVISATEQISGKRLQAHWHAADGPRVAAWAQLVRERFGLADPNAPERRRGLSLPHQLPPRHREATAELHRQVLDHRAELRTQQDLIELLKERGYAIGRVTATSVSVRVPGIKKPVRLRGDLVGELAADPPEPRAETPATAAARLELERRFVQLVAKRASWLRRRHPEAATEGPPELALLPGTLAELDGRHAVAEALQAAVRGAQSLAEVAARLRAHGVQLAPKMHGDRVMAVRYRHEATGQTFRSDYIGPDAHLRHLVSREPTADLEVLHGLQAEARSRAGGVLDAQEEVALLAWWRFAEGYRLSDAYDEERVALAEAARAAQQQTIEQAREARGPVPQPAPRTPEDRRRDAAATAVQIALGRDVVRQWDRDQESGRPPHPVPEGAEVRRLSAEEFRDLLRRGWRPSHVRVDGDALRPIVAVLDPRTIDETHVGGARVRPWMPGEAGSAQDLDAGRLVLARETPVSVEDALRVGEGWARSALPPETPQRPPRWVARRVDLSELADLVRGGLQPSELRVDDHETRPVLVVVSVHDRRLLPHVRELAEQLPGEAVTDRAVLDRGALALRREAWDASLWAQAVDRRQGGWLPRTPWDGPAARAEWEAAVGWPATAPEPAAPELAAERRHTGEHMHVRTTEHRRETTETLADLANRWLDDQDLRGNAGAIRRRLDRLGRTASDLQVAVHDAQWARWGPLEPDGPAPDLPFAVVGALPQPPERDWAEARTEVLRAELDRLQALRRQIRAERGLGYGHRSEVLGSDLLEHEGRLRSLLHGRLLEEAAERAEHEATRDALRELAVARLSSGHTPTTDARLAELGADRSDLDRAAHRVQYALWKEDRAWSPDLPEPRLVGLDQGADREARDRAQARAAIGLPAAPAAPPEPEPVSEGREAAAHHHLLHALQRRPARAPELARLDQAIEEGRRLSAEAPSAEEWPTTWVARQIDGAELDRMLEDGHRPRWVLAVEDFGEEAHPRPLIAVLPTTASPLAAEDAAQSLPGRPLHSELGRPDWAGRTRLLVTLDGGPSDRRLDTLARRATDRAQGRLGPDRAPEQAQPEQAQPETPTRVAAPQRAVQAERATEPNPEPQPEAPAASEPRQISDRERAIQVLPDYPIASRLTPDELESARAEGRHPILLLDDHAGDLVAVWDPAVDAEPPGRPLEGPHPDHVPLPGDEVAVGEGQVREVALVEAREPARAPAPEPAQPAAPRAEPTPEIVEPPPPRPPEPRRELQLEPPTPERLEQERAEALQAVDQMAARGTLDTSDPRWVAVRLDDQELAEMGRRAQPAAVLHDGAPERPWVVILRVDERRFALGEERREALHQAVAELPGQPVEGQVPLPGDRGHEGQPVRLVEAEGQPDLRLSTRYRAHQEQLQERARERALERERDQDRGRGGRDL